MELNVKNVRELVLDCLLKENELENEKPLVDVVNFEGIVHNFTFHKERLESHFFEIEELVGQVHNMSEGLSFLSMCVSDRKYPEEVAKNKSNKTYEYQWGEHIDVEQLIALGIASGILSFMMPRPYWVAFPGGVPYVCYSTTYLKLNEEGKKLINS